jgi:hypothetical protein
MDMNMKTPEEKKIEEILMEAVAKLQEVSELNGVVLLVDTGGQIIITSNAVNEFRRHLLTKALMHLSREEINQLIESA